MYYATIEDIEVRNKVTFSHDQYLYCETLIEDASTIIDAYNKNASEDVKRVVCCNMVSRLVANDFGQNTFGQVPVGTTQSTVSALGYSQTWTMANGSGELYLSKTDKKLLGAGNRIGFTNPYE